MESAVLHTFPIQSHEREFLAGFKPDGSQVLLVPISELRVGCLIFDLAGSLVSVTERAGRLQDDGSVAVAEDLADLIMSPGTIAVRKFSVPKYGIGIQHRPQWFDEFLADPETSEPDAQYRERTSRQIREWDEQGRFVFATWGKEYWMNGDGTVFAS